MATRNLIERLSGRIEAISARTKRRRVFRIIAHSDQEEADQVEALRRDHGMTADDLLIVRRIIEAPNRRRTTVKDVTKLAPAS
jgi:hypothetical protein